MLSRCEWPYSCCRWEKDEVTREVLPSRQKTQFCCSLFHLRFNFFAFLSIFCCFLSSQQCSLYHLPFNFSLFLPIFLCFLSSQYCKLFHLPFNFSFFLPICFLLSQKTPCCSLFHLPFNSFLFLPIVLCFLLLSQLCCTSSASFTFLQCFYL